MWNLWSAHIAIWNLTPKMFVTTYYTPSSSLLTTLLNMKTNFLSHLCVHGTYSSTSTMVNLWYTFFYQIIHIICFLLCFPYQVYILSTDKHQKYIIKPSETQSNVNKLLCFPSPQLNNKWSGCKSVSFHII